MKKIIGKAGELGYATMYVRGDIRYINKIHGDIRNVRMVYGGKIGDIVEDTGEYELKEKDKIINKVLDILYKLIT